MLSCFSHVQLFAILWTVVCLAPLSMGFSWQEYWSELPCPPPGDLADTGIKRTSPGSPALQVDSLPLSTLGKPGDRFKNFLCFFLFFWIDVIGLNCPSSTPHNSIYLFPFLSQFLPILVICGVGEDSWESLGLQRDQTSPSERKSVLNIHWKDWCWSWSSYTLATWCEELTPWKRPDAGKDWR